MQGRVATRTAHLSEFWNGQKNIVLLDPNILACEDWKEMLQELIDSKANVDFSQGLDIRLMDDEKLEMLKRIKFKTLHFAWDNYEDGEWIMPKLEWLKERTGWGKTKVMVYVLCNYNTTHEEDYERCLYIRELRFQPYVMIYDKKNVKRGSEINKLARWCNWSPYCWGFDTYEEFKKVMYKS